MQFRPEDERRNFHRTFDHSARQQLRQAVVRVTGFTFRRRAGIGRAREPLRHGAVNVLRLQPEQRQGVGVRYDTG